jgi:hypothetical protein
MTDSREHKNKHRHSINDLTIDCHIKSMLNQNNESKKKVPELMSDEISSFLSKIENKYSGNADQKHLNQMYDIGILVVNKNFNQKKLIQKITKIIEDRSKDQLKTIRELKRKSLMDAFKQGIEDASSPEYRYAYDDANQYQYSKEKLKKRAYIDGLLDKFNENNDSQLAY